MGIFHEFAPLVSIVAVILSYMFAEKIHGSGYMATFVMGLVCGNKKTFKLRVPTEDFEIQEHVRETGVIPAALSSMIVSMNIPYKGIISSVVFITILLTLGVQASTTKLVAKKLNVLDTRSKYLILNITIDF